MVFTVSCPECSSEFPVDSAKVPDDGVYASCSICPGTFLVECPADSVDEQDPTPSFDEAPDMEASDMPDAFDAAESDEVGGAAEVGAQESEYEEEAAPAPVAGAESATCGQTDPDGRAARLARVLVSDMMTYNPAMYAKAVEAGTLVEDFEEEVKRSWSEYVEQVGEDLAGSTQHFTRALNDILAKGEELFDEGMYA